MYLNFNYYGLKDVLPKLEIETEMKNIAKTDITKIVGKKNIKKLSMTGKFKNWFNVDLFLFVVNLQLIENFI